MKRDDMNIDEILKKYLPRASQEEVDEAGETVLQRINEMRFDGKPSAAREVKKRGEFGWLHDAHVAILMAVDELQGYGHPVSIALKVKDILEEPIAWGTAVFLILLLMERMELVSSSPIDPEKPGELDQRYFVLTEFGRETLVKAIADRQRASERVRRPLKGFA
jgi:hypothetical protein